MRSRTDKDFLIFTLSLWILFLGLELIFRVNSFYRIFPLIDVPAHFLSGLALAATFLFILSHYTRYRAKVAYSLLLVFIVAVAWEMVEMVQEIFVLDPIHLRDYFFWDGFFDIVVEIVGALSFFLILRIIKKKTGLFKSISL